MRHIMLKLHNNKKSSSIPCTTRLKMSIADFIQILLKVLDCKKSGYFVDSKCTFCHLAFSQICIEKVACEKPDKNALLERTLPHCARILLGPGNFFLYFCASSCKNMPHSEVNIEVLSLYQIACKLS